MARNWSKEEEFKWMEEEQREIENDSYFPMHLYKHLPNRNHSLYIKENEKYKIERLRILGP